MRSKKKQVSKQDKHKKSDKKVNGLSNDVPNQLDTQISHAFMAKPWQALYEAIATYVQGKKHHDE
jgi:hypothetical protein